MPEFSPSPPLIRRADRLVASAFIAVLFVMTAVPAAHASPNLETILRKSPTSEHTDADTLTWLLTFTEPVRNVDPTDFVVSGTTATLALEPLALDEEGCSRQWDATLSGGDPEDLNGTVTLTVSDDQEIWGCLGDDEVMTHPGPNDMNDNTFVVANEGQGDPESCSGGGYNPTPVEVEVTAVPIVVTSTTADYFVLYVKHVLVEGRREVEIPVLVKKGEADTTTLSESVEALPAERYRVEKYLIADPGDVDGDCIDDITELADPVGMNPVNPAPAIELSDGAVAVPDRETFDTLAFNQNIVKFVMFDWVTDAPGVYFMNTNTHGGHPSFLDAVGIDRYQLGLVEGYFIYDSELVAPDGSLGVYYYWLSLVSAFSFAARNHTLLAASMPLLDDNLAYYIANDLLQEVQSDLPLYRDSRITLVFEEDVWPETRFLALNPAEGYGLLRVMDPDERPHPRDIVIYEALPNELSRVAGIITTVPQTPLSHVNLRAVQDGIPNAFIRDALDKPAIDDLIGSYVRYTVTESGWTLRAATPAEVEAHYAASRPAGDQTPQRDLSVTGIKPLSEIGFDDWKAFGVKAANLAVLRTLGFPAGTVPDGFAIPFYFYDEFMKAHGFYDDVEEMLADEDFQTDFEVQDDRLDDLRDDIKDAGTPQWIIDALTAMHATYPEGQSLRYRSSTNNEDLPGFNGAGLYDSKTQDPEETEEDGIDKSFKQVLASLWTFRAFTEREFHRIDHLAAAMGVLVHPNYSDELANGVAVSFDPIRGQDGNYYVNTQLGEDLVTNPEAHSVPEELLLRSLGNYTILATSNLVEPGQLLMSDDQLRQLRAHLEVIHDHFKGLYDPAPGERFAMEIEFKITSDDILAIKQARPWVFDNARDAPPPPPTPPPSPPRPPPGGGGGGGGGLLFPPEAPAALMATPGDGMVRLAWSPPESDGGIAILRYEYRLKEGRGGFGEWTPIEDSAPGEVNAGGYTVGELDNGTVYVFELRAVNLVDEGPETEAVEVVMLLDRAYWSNFLAEDLQGSEAGLEHTPFGGTPRSLRLRFGAGLRFEEDELDGEGEVTATRLGSYGYRYTSRTTGELRLDYDGGEACELRMTFRGVGAGSYSYRCGGRLRGQGSFRLTGLNRGPEITGAGQFEVVENQARVGQLEAVDPDEGDEVTGYGIAGGADGALFAVDEETGELMFREAPDYETPGDVESAEPESGAGDNEYVVVVEVRSGEGERERKGERAVRVRVSDEEEPPEITSTGPFEVMENATTVVQLEAVDPDEGDEVTGYGIAGGADGGLFAVDEETGELMFREAPDYENPGDVESAEPESGAGDNEYLVVVEVRSGEGERERKGERAIRVGVSDEEEPPEITSTGPFEVVENQAMVGQLEAVDPDEGDEVTGYGIAGGTDGALFAVDEETGELTFREVPDYENPGDVESAEPESGAGDNEYLVVVEVRSGEGERERKGERAIRVRVSDEEEPPEITGAGMFEVVENQTRVGRLEAADPDEGDEVTGYGIAGGADGALFAVDEETGELRFREAPDYETPGDVESAEPESGAADNEYIVVVEVRSGEGERERKGSRATRVRVSDEEEPPEAPAAPAVTPEGSGRLKVSWREPENRGPEITDYDVRYREAGEEVYSDGGHEGTGLEGTLSGLKEGTVYEVQVRAVNEEGMSEWSEPGEGRTDTEEAAPDDPSDFTEEDLEGRRLTLRLTDEEGAAGSLELRFGEGNRFEQTEPIRQEAVTRSEGTASRSGTYAYRRTGPHMGTITLDYDDGASCEVRLSFTESRVGGFVYDCGEGNPAAGSFRLTTGSLFVPVILSAAGRNRSFFTSELTLTNRGERDVELDYTYTAKQGGGSGTASEVLEAGRQKIQTDALGYLIGLGVPIPETGNRIGTLRVEVPLGSEVEAVVRTTTVVPDGRAGLAYLGVAEEEGFTEAVYLCGLRQNDQDRSNLALQNMGTPEEGAITLRATVYSGEAGDATARVLEEVTLGPGGFHQYSPVLGSVANGYVKVERVEGEAPFYAYGVINDQANSDGSFVFPVTASSLEGKRGQTLPVIVETSEFRSELTVTNFSQEPRTLDFEFVAERIKADDKTAAFSMKLEAGQQEIIAEVVEELRRQGVAGLGSTRGFYAGPLFVEAGDGDMSGIVVGGRTGSEGGGGSYSVFYNAVPEGEAFSREAWVEGLQQNEENRSNLALVNTGEVDASASVFHLEIYDGETGMLVQTVVTGPVPARRWHQINGILGSYAPETRQGYIRIEKVSGANPFLAYGVVNDGGAPGERSGDGAYLPARE